MIRKDSVSIFSQSVVNLNSSISSLNPLWQPLDWIATLYQWFSTFLLRPFNEVPQVVVISPPNHKIILMLLHNCHFATAMNCIVNIWYAGYLICNLQRRITTVEGQGVHSSYYTLNLQPSLEVFFIFSYIKLFTQHIHTTVLKMNKA